MFRRKILLPQTLKEFDTLVTQVGRKYKLEDLHHAAAMISVAIRHLPSTQSYTTLDYLGQFVQKSIANYVADHKSKLMSRDAQLAQLAEMLKTDPANTQARDQLQLAANDGSEIAKELLKTLEEESMPSANA